MVHIIYSPLLFSWEPNLYSKEKMRSQINVQASDGWLGSWTSHHLPTRGNAKHDSHPVLHVLDGTSAPHPPLTQWVVARIWAMRLFVRSGPWSNWSFNEVSPNQAAQSKTTYTLPGLCLWMTRWCGRYHRVCHRDLSDHLEFFWHDPLQCNHSGSCNISPSELDPSETSSQGNEPWAKRHNDYRSKKEVYNAMVGPVDPSTKQAEFSRIARAWQSSPDIANSLLAWHSLNSASYILLSWLDNISWLALT